MAPVTEEQSRKRASERRTTIIGSPIISENKNADAGYRTPSSISVFIFMVVPMLISLWYAIAILFPPDARSKASLLLWTDGAFIKNYNRTGRPAIYPRASICSEGIFQIILIGLARLTAFASYVVTGLTFMSKMHSTIHFLTSTYASYFIPFESLHHLHRKAGMWYMILALMHTITHLVRYAVRKEMGTQMKTQTVISGVFAMFLMLVVVGSMSVAKRFKQISFERRFNFHWFFILLTAALCFHTPRTRVITLLLVGLWSLDYAYGLIFRTNRLDVVEFVPLPEGNGTQMLWRNPKGFQPTSGEYVKVKIPWLETGGNEWHPFSLYLREATEEGLRGMTEEGVRGMGDEVEEGLHGMGDEVKGGREVCPSTKAFLLLEFQNEFCSHKGKLHDQVRDVMQSNGMIQKTAKLAEVVRSVGAHVFHAPFIHSDSISPNPNMAIMESMRNKENFIKGTWGANLADTHKQQPGDSMIMNNNAIDAFLGTNLEDLIFEKGIETLIVGGFLTNACVESTIRQAYDKGLNVISLVDGTACGSLEEQKAATEVTYKLFSNPMSCAKAAQVLLGENPNSLTVASFQAVSNTDSTAESYDMGEDLTLEEFIEDTLQSTERDASSGYLVKTVREDIKKKYETTQIFIAPAGDWSNGVLADIVMKKHGRSCWMTGPYTSPYSIAGDFSHLVLTASGIGITPALGVMGQFPDSTRTKILVWSIRSRRMLEFFIPLLRDAHLAVIFYTGKEQLSNGEVQNIRSYSNIYLQQSRPKSLSGTIESIIITFEQETHGVEDMMAIASNQLIGSLHEKLTVKNIPRDRAAAWCILYCGGSVHIKNELKAFAKEAGTGWDCELFDW